MEYKIRRTSNVERLPATLSLARRAGRTSKAVTQSVNTDRLIESSTLNIKTLTLLVAMSFMILLGAGCETGVETKPRQFPGSVDGKINEPAQTMTPLSDFMQRRSVAYNDGRTVTFLIVKLDAENFRWGMANDPASPKTVLAWRRELGADLVINGSYFDESMQPTGYYHEAGATGTRITWPLRDNQKDETGYTGLVQIVDGNLNLFYLPAEPQKESPSDVAAFLTFPTLISDGKSLIKTDSQKFAHRTIIAKDLYSAPYIIITESGLPSLYEVAEWLIDQPEKFVIAVNLDGGPSTGISYADDEIKLEVTSASVPNVIYLKKADGR